MTIPELKEIVKESGIWKLLSPGDKIEALVYAVEHDADMLANPYEHLDVTDIIVEMFVMGR